MPIAMPSSPLTKFIFLFSFFLVVGKFHDEKRSPVFRNSEKIWKRNRSYPNVCYPRMYKPCWNFFCSRENEGEGNKNYGTKRNDTSRRNICPRLSAFSLENGPSFLVCRSIFPPSSLQRTFLSRVKASFLPIFPSRFSPLRKLVVF